ncbi:hypothetical protein K227x_60250 [Rubripirellula lacrimiformis]|uniref:Uncharacterized protein n=1 Tax=Rubripirellula lacrimiformis TaxID=1930273 RepID=A0A517NKC8_9BACT|nr:hypothetical protein [Rubripirellula lacrimiformis]QDT07597.1 hypothetical protein K227x_60250 [Rubripirellula lacrimiformis]
MIGNRTGLFLAAGMASMLLGSVDQAAAQCSRGGGGGGPSTGSTMALNSSLPYSSNPLVSNSQSSSYPSSISLMAQQYQQRAAQIQNQGLAIGYQNAERQRLSRIAYEERVRPMRLARAEAKRAARADRIAARLAERDGVSEPASQNRYSLTSVVSP